jgi:hypothetical protein
MFEEDIPSMENTTFYTLQDESFNRRVHTDFAAPQKKRQTEDYPQLRKRKRPLPDKRPRPEQDQWDGEPSVKDRLLPLMRIGAHDEIKTSQVLMHFNIDTKFGPRIHLEVYRTTRPDLHRAHGPSKDNNGNVLPGLVQYPVAFVDLPNMSRSFKKQEAGKDKDGEDRSFYRVLGLVEMRKDGDSLKVVVTLLKGNFDWKCSKDGMFLSSCLPSPTTPSHHIDNL